MTTLHASAEFVDYGGTPGRRVRHAPPTSPGSRYKLGRAAFILILLPLLVASLAAAAWSSWTLAAGALGRQGAVLGVVALVAGAAALSRHTGRGFAHSLILVGFGGLTLLFGALFGVAGFTMMFGG